MSFYRLTLPGNPQAGYTEYDDSGTATGRTIPFGALGKDQRFDETPPEAWVRSIENGKVQYFPMWNGKVSKPSGQMWGSTQKPPEGANIVEGGHIYKDGSVKVLGNDLNWTPKQTDSGVVYTETWPDGTPTGRWVNVNTLDPKDAPTGFTITTDSAGRKTLEKSAPPVTETTGTDTTAAPDFTEPQNYIEVWKDPETGGEYYILPDGTYKPKDQKTFDLKFDSAQVLSRRQGFDNKTAREQKAQAEIDAKNSKLALEQLYGKLQDVASGKIKSPAEEEFEKEYKTAMSNISGMLLGSKGLTGSQKVQTTAQSVQSLQMAQAQDQAIIKAQQQADAIRLKDQIAEALRRGDLTQADVLAAQTEANRALTSKWSTAGAARAYDRAASNINYATGRANAANQVNRTGQAQTGNVVGATIGAIGSTLGAINSFPQAPVSVTGAQKLGKDE